ncbi:PREDICTED: GEM-like protein 4 [Lupinus angustifolius]|uniref:GEM-like protein 4 n=1 Tax=Lupinus angustifolius TaxID=3871 RepID=UPI00092E8D3A|nr:PREDICTED: GEM-like protein 4 [Lupinus angustifolius]
MKTTLFHELVIGTPIISKTYDQLEKSVTVSRYLPDPAIQCQYSTTTSKQSRLNSITNKLERKTDGLSQGVREHRRLAPKISETVKGKLSLGAQILKAGGLERVFKQFFSIEEGESLLKVSQCYLSTTSGPLAGFLFISTHKVAFCSERSIKVFNGKGQMCRIRYKVIIPLQKVKCVNQSENVYKPKQKYLQIVTADNFDFWLMCVSKYQKTLKYLEQAISQA